MTNMKGAIIAAGRGSRLNSSGGKKIPKPLYKIFDKPIIYWVVDAMKRANIKNIFIVLGYKGQMIQEYFGDGDDYGVNITYVYNSSYKKDLIYSVQTLRPYLNKEKEFILSMADQLYDPNILVKFSKVKLPLNSILLCVDKKFDQIFDIDDATKILVSKNDNKILSSHGKIIKNYDYVDCGLHKYSAAIFEAINDLSKGNNLTANKVLNYLGKKAKASIWDLGDKKWADIDTIADLNAAETKMNNILLK